ncbi:5'-3' exonuclease H3TH domain-containing protein [Pseudomonadota bacterium]
MKKFFIIDGNAIFHRAYHSMPPFKTSKGEVTNAIYGFMRMLLDLYLKEKPDFLGIAWDRKKKTFRHEEFADYKATRKEAPDDLFPQLPRLKEIISAFNIPSLELDGFEADDILGTIARKAEEEPDLQVTIVTGDKDAFQLVDDKVRVMTPVTGITKVVVYDPAKVKEKMGVRPDQVIDFKALMGDPSDNIPGVPGIGQKQALELLHKYDTLENIYEHLEELKEGQQKKFTEGRESAELSKRLATIVLDVPVEYDLAKYVTHDIAYDKAEELFTELEFKSLIRRLEELQGILKKPEAEQQSMF